MMIDLAYLLGMGTALVCYILMVAIVIRAFLNPGHTVLLNFNLYNEMVLELVIMLISIPPVLLFVKNY